MATFLVAHGAWSAGWAWKKMHPLMRAAGHEFIVPTYTGLGERAHLATPSIDLETHVQDILGVLETEELTGVTLLGHSYGGMVATVVADRARERLSQLIYLDAFVPKDGQCLLDFVPKNHHPPMNEGGGEGWRVKPNPIPKDTSEADVEWIMRHRMPQPIKTMQQPARLKGTPPPPISYIYCKKHVPGDVFRPFAERAKQEGWRYFELDESHSPAVTAPDALFKVLTEIVKTPVHA